MPRRTRKNSASQRKPSLIFTESPVNLTRSTASPVRCANHPQTAKVIPVEDLADLTWVSPQFQGARTSCRRRGGRRRNLSRSTINTRSWSNGTGKENLQCSFGARRKLLNGFVPLRFELDKSVELTEIEDVSDVDAETDLNFTRNVGLDRTSFNTTAAVTPPAQSPHRDRGTGQQGDSENNGEAQSRFVLSLSTLNQLCAASERRKLEGDMVDIEMISMQKIEDNEQSKNSPDIGKLRRSSRLRDKYREAVELLRSPSGSEVNEEKPCKILVLDTPESEYGLTRRHLRNKIRKNFIYSKLLH
ncbi:uncharacterized protein LOC135468560 [Liolophura sinensis]|uniref:uncharacterized protein LOC135468560 n=1 Tax=Liolophura sinensis TaxID=3198878 RepID=UPI0031599281